MKLSLNWVKKHTTIAVPPTELIAKIGAQIGAIEHTVNWGERYRGVVVVRIAKVSPHPNADRLHIVEIDDATATQAADRLPGGHVQVVCGAPNVREGLRVAWIPPGVTVPATYDDSEPFVLDARPLRGVVSNGMLASPKELGLSDDHDGILELPDDTPPGLPFASLYDLDDHIIDIENKMFTHRPDCFGQLGVAREIAGIQNIPFHSPDWYTERPQLPGGEGLQLKVRNEVPGLAPRYMAVAFDNVKVQPSPLWLQSELYRLGARPVNNVVDLTNYLMLTTGQPLHAFDFDKVAGGGDSATIVVRKPHANEQIVLLDGKTITPHKDAVLICNEQQPLALGGVMGGAYSEISPATTRIILEVATFDMYAIRRTSMAHGIFTDAVTRFSKGQSPAQNAAVLAYAADMLVQHFNAGRVASPVADEYPNPLVVPQIELTSRFINERLGASFDTQTIADMLRGVEWDVEQTETNLRVKPPFWRMDIAIPEDIVEEIGRLYGFSNLPVTLPTRDLTPVHPDLMLGFKSRIRAILARAGANELQTYSFVHGALLQKAGQDMTQAYKLRNAISPDLQYYRVSVTPGLLEKIHPNIRRGYRQFALFELGKVHHKARLDEHEPDLPAEDPRVALVVAADAKAAADYPGAPFYQAKYLLGYLVGVLGLTVKYRPLEQDDVPPEWAAPFEPARSAAVVIGQQVVGVVGEYRQQVQRSFKLPEFAAGFELDTSLLHRTVSSGSPYAPGSQFPGLGQDVCFAVAMHVTYAQLYAAVIDGLPHDKLMDIRVNPVDIYQRTGAADQKQITLHIHLQHHQRTLTSKEANDIIGKMTAHAGRIVGAKQI